MTTSACLLKDSKEIESKRKICKLTVWSAATGIETPENGFPKPTYSYACLIALALKNSYTGSLSVSEIYKFICEHFPYFKNAPSEWKNAVRQKLCMNKCFEKIEKPASSGGQRRGWLWAMKPSEIQRMDNEVKKWSSRDIQAIKEAMPMPDCLDALESGEMKKDYNTDPGNLTKEKIEN